MNNATKRFCPSCKEEIKEGSRFCPQCGKELGICSNCGAPLASGDDVCPKCGAKQASDRNQPHDTQQELTELKPAITARQLAYSDLRGCYHDERPKVHSCAKCGSPLCYECSVEELVASRVVGYSSIDTAVGQDYAFFCPSCYIERISDSDYRTVRGGGNPGVRADIAPNLFNPLSYSGPFLIVMNIILIAVAIFMVTSMSRLDWGLPPAMVVLVVAAALDMLFYHTARNEFRKLMTKKRKALDLLEDARAKL